MKFSLEIINTSKICSRNIAILTISFLNIKYKTCCIISIESPLKVEENFNNLNG